MAMSKCKECGKSISTLAKTCPGCGAPNPTGKASSSKSKTENYKPKGAIQILAAIGLVIAILWTAKGLFQAGSAGYKEVKNKIEKSDKKKSVQNKIWKKEFTCEGEIISSYRGDTSSSGMFIDEYTISYDSNNRIHLLYLNSNNYYGRRNVIDDITVTSSSITIRDRNYTLGEGRDQFKFELYESKISINSGTFAGRIYGEIDRTALNASFNGKCFGLDKINIR
mgnify:FL=1